MSRIGLESTSGELRRRGWSAEGKPKDACILRQNRCYLHQQFFLFTTAKLVSRICGNGPENRVHVRQISILRSPKTAIRLSRRLQRHQIIAQRNHGQEQQNRNREAQRLMNAQCVCAPRQQQPCRHHGQSRCQPHQIERQFNHLVRFYPECFQTPNSDLYIPTVQISFALKTRRKIDAEENYPTASRFGMETRPRYRSAINHASPMPPAMRTLHLPTPPDISSANANADTLTTHRHSLYDKQVNRILPPRSMVGQLPLEQSIGVRIPGGQPVPYFVALP